jgi:hypothetical protein
MEPFSKKANWANDWLEGGITLVKEGKELSFSMKHLLIEELEDFKNWLFNIKESTLTSYYFMFIDADLFFEVIEVDGALTLRIKHGYVGEAQIIIDTNIADLPEFIDLQIERINALLERFPCRCGLEHNLFSKQV